MAYDEKTTFLGLPLPHPRNTLREDCPRIRESLQGLDGFAKKTDASLSRLLETDTALSEANAALTKAVQDQAEDLTEAISRETEARSQADADHDDAIAALTKQIEALQETVAKIDPWGIFPVRVSIAVDGVTFGGSDGRRAILPGETEARENWVKCDGGSDGKGGTVPDLRGRMIMGASDAYAAGSTGGSATHAHVFSGTVGATTISIDQMPWHGHTNYNRIAYGSGGNGAACNAGEPNGTTATGNAVIPTGGSAAHGHAMTGTVSAANDLPPYYALAYIMRVA
ncbi:MAG TPA: hypothetical protein H9774_12665 [Candidatus Desulfovibrio gallistercoris]|nr:hypothetical protein [Candidatus Desulfovibrio gallistercoris]